MLVTPYLISMATPESPRLLVEGATTSWFQVYRREFNYSRRSSPKRNGLCGPPHRREKAPKSWIAKRVRSSSGTRHDPEPIPDHLAISTDAKERAERSRSEWSIERLAIAYGLGIEEARQWGLYISSAIKEGEPPRFAEPGLFLIRPDGTLYCSSVQTMPFARPSFAEVLQAVAFITERSYPARGEA